MTVESKKSLLKHWTAALLMLLGSTVAIAATPANWWVDIANDRASTVQQMLRAGTDPNQMSESGQPAIMQAIRDGAWEVYDLLARDSKTALNAININHETPLMYLAITGETARAQDLIQRGAQVNRLGWTPLHYAASKGHVDTVRMLIANKAIINAPAPDGTTPLMMAAFSGSTDTVQVLLHAGADATTLNLDKHDAADWARLRKHTHLADKLDVLIERVLATRAAMRRGESPEGDLLDNTELDLDSAPVPEQATNTESDTSSTSRYFDLDRFDENPVP